MTVDRTTSEGLRLRLRRSTARAHQQLEATISVEAMCASLELYRDLLGRMWGVYAPLEAALMRVDWPRSAAWPSKRRKAPWLRDDLLSLGMTDGEIGSLPVSTSLPVVASPADAFGVLYVLEGATLGGQVILPRVATLGLSADRGARFYAGYGRETGAYWRAFVDRLEAFGESTPIADRIEAAAIATFESIRAWMGDGAAKIAQREKGSDGV